MDPRSLGAAAVVVVVAVVVVAVVAVAVVVVVAAAVAAVETVGFLTVLMIGHADFFHVFRVEVSFPWNRSLRRLEIAWWCLLVAEIVFAERKVMHGRFVGL